ncbi:MAG: hypothetical protein KC731_08735 [Myxococcales bacterium]|nr:hypothetical protein [Myxococcales bacterium]
MTGDLHFFEDNVSSFAGLTKLHTVGGWLRLNHVLDLESLQGLENVRSLARLEISYNPKLRTLSGLAGLVGVTGDVEIKGNDLLPAAEVDALLARVEVGGTVDRD